MPEATTDTTTLTDELNDKQRRFVNEYLVDLNVKHAAIRAGYSEKTAQEQGSRLLAHVKVKAAVEKAMDEREERTEITQDYVLKSIQRVANRCMQAVPVMERVDGEWVRTGEFRFDSSGANKALELLGKHLRLWNDVGSKENPLHVMSDEEINKELTALLLKARE